MSWQPGNKDGCWFAAATEKEEGREGGLCWQGLRKTPYLRWRLRGGFAPSLPAPYFQRIEEG